jgi:hypothetical protein
VRAKQDVELSKGAGALHIALALCAASFAIMKARAETFGVWFLRQRKVKLFDRGYRVRQLNIVRNGTKL